MFGLFRKKKEVRRISEDLQQTLEKSYDLLRAAVDIKDVDKKHHYMHAHLTSLSLALHNVYPGFPQEKDSLFTRFIASDLEQHPDCSAYRDAIEKHIRACPNIRAAKFDFMTYLLAPSFMEEFTKKQKGN